MESEQAVLNGENKEMNLESARRILADARQAEVRACQEALNALLAKHKCSLATHQEWINGMPRGPAQVIVVPAE